MRALALAVIVLLSLPACVVETQKQPAPSLPPPQVASPDLDEARFCSRQPGGDQEHALALSSLALKLTTAGHTVRSHLTMVVKNPTATQAEAALRLPLPPGAAVSRAVLHVDGRPMEGAFVQRDRARFIYRSITERRRDPALVVWRGPEWVEVSIFPVEPNGGERTFEIQWIEPIASSGQGLWYRLPVLAHRGQVVGRPASVIVDGKPLAMAGGGWIQLAGQAPTAPAVARRPGDPFGLIIARDQGPAPASQEAGAGLRVVVVAETSAAMTVELRKQQRSALAGLLDALPPDAKVSLMRADWSVTALTERAGADAVRQTLDALDALPSAGALDLERALEAAADRAQADGATAVVWVGPGHDAFGGDPIAAPLKKLATARVALSVVGLPAASAPLTDAAWLSGGRPFTAAEVRGPTLKAVIMRPRAAPAQALERVESWHPLETVTGEVVWVGRFVGEAPVQGGRGEPRHLEALWARSRAVGSASQQGDLGQTHKVLTPLTSILVLEKDADYTRWGVPVPQAPTDEKRETRAPIVARPDTTTDVKPAARPERTGLFGLKGPAEQPAAEPPAAAAPAGAAPPSGHLRGDLVGDVAGTGALGLRGTGAGGGGAGEAGRLGIVPRGKAKGGSLGQDTGGSVGDGRGAGGYLNRPRGTAQIGMGTPEMRGSLDANVIRRVIRMNINQVRFCYERELQRSPEREGKVVLQFTIAPSGSVSSAAVRSSTLGLPAVEQCLVAAVRRWTFPQPAGGGIVVVAYPFVFRPGSGGSVGPLVPVDDPFTKALAILAEAATPLEARVGRIAAAVGAATTTSPQALAWSIVQDQLRSRWQRVEAYLLAALLLKEAKAERDAIRVLSEGAPRHGAPVADEMQRRGWTTDAARVRALQLRSTGR